MPKKVSSYRQISVQLNFWFYSIRSVVQRCIPIDITSLIDIAREKNINLEEIMNSTDIPLLPNAVENIKFFADFEAVSAFINHHRFAMCWNERFSSTQRTEYNMFQNFWNISIDQTTINIIHHFWIYFEFPINSHLTLGQFYKKKFSFIHTMISKKIVIKLIEPVKIV